MTTGITVGVGPTPSELVALKGISAYTVTEESTPVDPSDSTGAAGKFTFSSLEGAIRALDAKRMYRKLVRLEDFGQGFTTGIMRVPSYSAGQLSLSADLRSVLLNVTRQAQPFEGTAAEYFEYLLSLVDITDGFVVDPVFASMNVTFPGWNDNVWFKAKQFAAAKEGEITLASGNLVFRPLRQRIAVSRRDIDVSWSVDDTGLAQSVQGYWYDTDYQTDALAYPSGGWSPEVQVYQVDAGEVIEFDLPIDASLVSVQQPVAQDFVGRYDNSASVYSIQGGDGLNVLATQWTAAGGKIEVEIGEDTRSLVVTITGADIPELAPFQIAATAGPSDVYSSLRIVGEGVFVTSHLVTRGTGISADLATQEVGTVLDDPFITSYSELADRMAWTIARYAAPRQILNVRTKGINRQGDSGSYVYPTFDDFNAYAALQGWTDADDLNDAAPGLGWDIIEDFNAWWLATVSDSFENQAFGNVSGARVLRDGLWWRIRSNSITPADVSYVAEVDTTADDFNVYAESQGWATIDDLNTAWNGATFDDFNVAPLTNGA